MVTAIVTFLSDFGLKDPYVAEMKGIIMGICPEARIIDVSHEVEKFNIRMGAFVLASVAPYFPKGTIHVAVVDPGVGTKRRPILIETSHYYAGPDNGLLLLAAQNQGIRHVYNLTNSRCALAQVSKTFHGRDIFAPVAAHLACGSKPQDVGSEIHDYVVPKFAKPELTGKELCGEVLHIDDFGNIITNISAEDFGKTRIKEGSTFQLRLEDKEVRELRFCSAYGEVQIGKPLALIGSHDFLEISIYQGNASKKFRTKAEDTVTVVLGNQR